jgi:hypothetical protein
MISDLFSINYKDALHAVVNSVVAAIILALFAVVTTPNFNVFATDWGVIGQTIVNVSVVTFFSTIVTRYFSDSQGKFGGIF